MCSHGMWTRHTYTLIHTRCTLQREGRNDTRQKPHAGSRGEEERRAACSVRRAYACRELEEQTSGMERDLRRWSWGDAGCGVRDMSWGWGYAHHDQRWDTLRAHRRQLHPARARRWRRAQWDGESHVGAALRRRNAVYGRVVRLRQKETHGATGRGGTPVLAEGTGDAWSPSEAH